MAQLLSQLGAGTTGAAPVCRVQGSETLAPRDVPSENVCVGREHLKEDVGTGSYTLKGLGAALGGAQDDRPWRGSGVGWGCRERPRAALPITNLGTLSEELLWDVLEEELGGRIGRKALSC